MPTEIRTFPDPAALFQSAAREFVTLAKGAIEAGGRFSVALSGGSTPKNLYAMLGTMPEIPWEKIYLFFGDERDVAPDDPESNYRMVNEALLSRAPIPRENVFRVRTELKDAQATALEYEQTIQTFFKLKPGEFPRFDLIFLGMGPDGHTASLFPGSAAISETHRLVVANWVEKFQTHRITFTFPVLNHAACVTFLVSGADKAPMVREILGDNRADLPSAQVHPAHGRLVWLLDASAAAGLSAKP
jgi:6-phosphogluconolactonase